MEKTFYDLPIKVKGINCGNFAGTAAWDHNGDLEYVIIEAQAHGDPDVELKRSDVGWWRTFEIALEARYADDIGWLKSEAGKLASYFDLKRKADRERE